MRRRSGTGRATDLNPWTGGVITNRPDSRATPTALRRQRLAALEELHGVTIGRFHERHAPVARRAKDRDSRALERSAFVVDVVDLEREVAEEAARRVRSPSNPSCT